MTESRKPAGTIAWADLTVPDAVEVRAFYEKVVGWTSTELSMGDYADFCMNAGDGPPVAGVCHARGMNAQLPPVWMMYVIVDDLDHSIRECEASGGALVTPVRSPGDGSRYCVIRDPAGAMLAIFQQG